MNEELKSNGLLKFKLFKYGLNITDIQLQELLRQGYRIPSIVRTGASHGIESIINKQLEVNIPINKKSCITLSDDFKYLVVDNKFLCSIEILKNPYVYNLSLGNNEIIKGVAKICYDRLGIAVNTSCHFKTKGIGCKFCGIEHSSHFFENIILSKQQVLDILENAINRLGANIIRHILLSGGTFNPPDYGAGIFSKIAKAIKNKYPNLSIYVMMPPPEINDKLQLMIDSGIEEIGLNIELINEKNRKEMIPGKNQIGLTRYLSALEYLSKKMPKFGARSLLMGGVESAEDTLRGIEMICNVGAMPIISYYRPIGNEKIKNVFDSETEIFNLWERANDIAEERDMVIGPICIPCQNNVIALPNSDYHKYY